MTDPRSPRARRPGGRRPRAGARADAPRLVAYEVLRAVSDEDAYANLLLPARIKARGLDARDAAFATELVAGSLRRQGTYDAIIVACARRPLGRIDAAVLDALRLGTHQLLATRVAAHAAVATSVDLVRAQVGQSATGFVNAVLRKVGERSLDEWVRAVAPDPAGDPIGFAAVARSHPRWVVEELQRALGDRADELDDLLVADNTAPRVTLVARPGLSAQDELLQAAGEGAGGEATPYSPFGVVLTSGDPALIPAVGDGRAGVQDEGSQLVASALAAADVEGRDSTWLDLCAGPGGKATLLGAIGAGRGARVLAVERQPHRADLVVRAARALPAGTVTVVTGDGTAPAWSPSIFDRALVDAPCTGLGALRRRPESRWRRSADDLDGLVALQVRLLASALDAVRPGGVVVYSTCSPVLAETAGVVTTVLAGRSDTELADAGATLHQVPDAAGPLPGTVQLWPHRHGTDAMFVALLRRR
ncbi:MAG: 16S rRNA (cytosine(967)-C(5))-methyltransferase [uncultured Nocardioidaceae bacterium]|uniref:16S rRNA (Cytosine(967)-C(5))-methyltransferase n=1 Tax=uncultured Nocardioidaceae bacterium TaxID=253824 RepID=A0A6J4N2P0_9ACTN|nr:MAG: 16S rRNA (cytosine(967)-C(5))-methyltransferase [uncultured Nocardioidaceae bacterium]